ncbi:sigma 54-interacting transcriptional regulator [Clostridium sp. PL3]|uniref:Sigma 54-interacting transcriptional regulator n=1 Tax=Clostridium thailandense TaxID=2794346 RepID=A0A949TX09_9CLOT|nr:sigma 54-interacting transcriptional regulator [Clostridium thailandense]MBV7276807.1 sigma 54-interacting transcriptional regulator [Clostridium thailandense]
MENLNIDSIMNEIFETFCNLVVVDANGIIVYMNKMYSNLLGVAQEDAVGKHVTEVIPNTRLHIVAKTGVEEIGSLMTLYDTTKGEDITMVCNRIPIEENQKVIGVVAVTTLRDINEVESLHQEINRIKDENKKYKKQLDILKKNLNPLNKIIGKSECIRDVKRTIEDYAKSNLPVLITGETGVGKEVFANAIHQLSNRNMNNYVKINCAAIPKDLLESELFGYVEGAFSGAAKGGKMGKFELANNGTILLDEIGEMPLALQVKLLRILQEKELEKVGGLKSIKLDVRIICSTNQNIEDMVKNRTFREDLYYRINVIELPIPPLRERLDDIPLLCDFFIKRINKENDCRIEGVDQSVIELLNQHSWPGNVRELEHVVERATILCKRGIIQLNHCDFLVAKIRRTSNVGILENTLRDKKSNFEKEAIIEALKKTGGNKTKAAKLLNIDRSVLYNKIKKYNIEL